MSGEIGRDSVETKNGYYTRITGAYVCYTCGHLCDPDLHEESDNA